MKNPQWEDKHETEWKKKGKVKSYSLSAEVLFGIVNTGSLRFFWKCKKRKTNRNKKKKKENAFMYLPLLSLSFLGHKHASNLLIIMIVLSCKLTRLLARTAISKFAKYVTRSFSSVVFTFSFKIVATMFFGNFTCTLQDSM